MNGEKTLTKLLFKELPYYGVNIISSHGQFNNLMESELSNNFHYKIFQACVI